MILFAITLFAQAAIPAQAISGSDLRDYALAACLIEQDASKPLQTEGYRLADIVLQRAGRDPIALKPLAAVVRGTLAKQGMLMVHVDAPVEEATQPAPLASCLQVIDDPAVRRIIAGLERRKKR